MKHLLPVLCLLLLATCAQAQSEAEIGDVYTRGDAPERERIRQARTSAQAQFSAQEAQCYTRFAVNDCLADVRGHRRVLLADVRRQEISLNDAQRKRRAAEQLLRSDARAPQSP
jgi:colicin import membrane protein